MSNYFKTIPSLFLRVVKTSSADFRPKFFNSCNFSGEYSNKSPIVLISARPNNDQLCVYEGSRYGDAGGRRQAAHWMVAPWLNALWRIEERSDERRNTLVNGAERS